MEPQKGGPAAVLRFGLFVRGESIQQLFVGAGQRRRQQRRRPVPGMHLRSPQVRFDRTVHKIVTAGSVGMDVDKARRNIIALRIDNRTGRLAVVRPLLHRSNLSVGKLDATVGKHTLRQYDPAVYNDRFVHVSILFRICGRSTK